MKLVDLLINKKIKVTEIPKWGIYLRNQWENHFANDLSEDVKSAINITDNYGYLWHLFSFEKKECLVEEHAEEAFNKEPKSTCFVFYQHSNYALILDDSSSITAADLQNEQDIYIVDKDFNWTYVKTHETGCFGPYFSRK